MNWLNEAWNWLWMPIGHPIDNFWYLWVTLMVAWLAFKHLLTKHGDK